MKRWLYIANWKMNMPLGCVSTWYLDNAQDIETVAAQQDVELVICPSFISIIPLKELIQKHSHISIGAQDCAAYPSGPYTGDVDIISLKQAGCSYGIVGHRERRLWHNETDDIIALKIAQLYQCNMTPIVCIGESEKQPAISHLHTILKYQLEYIFPHILPNAPIVLAYEPASAIGTGVVPAVSELSEVFCWLKEYVHACMPRAAVRYVYGGSVQAAVSAQLKQIAAVDGFLIGNASLQWHTLADIMRSPVS